MFAGFITSIGVGVISGINLRHVIKCDLPQCTFENQAILISMLLIGVSALVLNITFRVAFDMRLFGGFRRSQKESLGFFQGFRELWFVCCCGGSRKSDFIIEQF